MQCDYTICHWKIVIKQNIYIKNLLKVNILIYIFLVLFSFYLNIQKLLNFTRALSCISDENDFHFSIYTKPSWNMDSRGIYNDRSCQQAKHIPHGIWSPRRPHILLGRICLSANHAARPFRIFACRCHEGWPICGIGALSSICRTIWGLRRQWEISPKTYATCLFLSTLDWTSARAGGGTERWLPYAQ